MIQKDILLEFETIKRYGEEYVSDNQWKIHFNNTIIIRARRAGLTHAQNIFIENVSSKKN